MGSHALKTIITVFVMIFLLIIGLSILKWAIRILLPIAVIIIAAYIVYRFVTRNRF